MPLRFTSAWLGLAVLACVAVVPAGCGPGRGAPAWIGQEDAVVRCVVAGYDKPASILLDLPAPMHPTGFYARMMDPVGLDKMGFQRNAPVCATLVPPTEEVLDAAGDTLGPLKEAKDVAAAQAVNRGGRCACVAANGLGLLHLVAPCIAMAQPPGCEIDEATAATVGDALRPLRDQIERATLVPIHWRLSGLTDREGWFAEALPDLLENHGSGSEVFVRGKGGPSQGNHGLIRALLEQDDVVAVVRQDGGAALLVAREVDGRQLVLDHFAHPTFASDSRGVIAHWDNTHVPSYLAALDPPANAGAPALDVRLGNLVEIRRASLERVDEGIAVSSLLARTPWDPRRERRREPPVLVDRIAWQAPTVRPEVLVGSIVLSGEGQTWASAIQDVVLSPTLDEIAVSDVAPTIDSAQGLDFIMRGTAVWRFLHGIHSFVPLMRRTEMMHPSTIKGRTGAFEFQLPTTIVEEGAAIDPALDRLVERLAATPHRFTGTMTPARDVITWELAPR